MCRIRARLLTLTSLTEDDYCLFSHGFFHFTEEAQLKNLHKIMGNNQWQVHVFESGTEVTYYPKRKMRKNIDKLYQNVFVLLDD